MSRGMWFVAGAATGIYAVAKARRTVLTLTPDGIGARLAAVRAGGRVFTEALREGRVEREAELRLQLEGRPPHRRLLTAATSPSNGNLEGAPSESHESLPDGHR
jgi:Family of unknown function (DUF6167)